MTVKAVVMTVGFFQEKKQERLIEKQKQEELTREQIRMEERNRIATMETNWKVYVYEWYRYVNYYTGLLWSQMILLCFDNHI